MSTRSPVVISVAPPNEAPAVSDVAELATVADHLAMLRRMIDQADAASAHLRALAERSTRSDAGTAKASVCLQERLRLGARMLQALQGQIDRVEAANAALEQQLTGLEDRLGQLVEGSCERLEAIARDAVRREIEKQLNGSRSTPSSGAGSART